jgi:hypothetical protein
MGLAPVASALFAAGCSKTGKVSGTVSFDGKPLPWYRITYVPAGGGQGASAESDGEGHYTINAPKGLCKICVSTAYLFVGPIGAGARRGPEIPVDKQINQNPEEAKMFDHPGHDIYVEIPSKYEDLEKSELTFTVGDGSQENSIDLKKPEGWKPQHMTETGPAGGRGGMPGQVAAEGRTRRPC